MMTEAQQRIATAQAETVVAIAGPGSGKTFTLVERYGLFSAQARTTIITFTNAAAASGPAFPP